MSGTVPQAIACDQAHAGWEAPPGARGLALGGRCDYSLMGHSGSGSITELLCVPGEGQTGITGHDSNLALGVKG